MKKRKKQRERVQSLKVLFDKSHIDPITGNIGINLSFDLVNDRHEVTLIHNNELVENHSLVQSYIGENKTRVITQIPVEPSDHSFNLIKKLQRFDSIIAMDTNSINHQTGKHNLGIAYHIIGKIKDKSIEWNLNMIRHLFVLVGDGEKIENRNWKQLIDFITSHKNYNVSDKIGLIVDSDLGNLNEYNKQLKPIIDDYYLPTNFELIFASDKVNDTILNNAIISCHKASKDILKMFVKKLDTLLQE